MSAASMSVSTMRFFSVSMENFCRDLTRHSTFARYIRELGADVEKVKPLPVGKFIALNRLSRATLEGKMF